MGKYTGQVIIIFHNRTEGESGSLLILKLRLTNNERKRKRVTEFTSVLHLLH
jgi:hypothetical protein